MKNPTENNAPGAVDNLDADLIKDLERQSIEEIRKLRAHERLDLRVQVSIQPGNSSQIGEMDVPGSTCDVSAGGCRILAPVPIGVGDIFRLQFDRERLDVPMVFARCVRCRFLREDRFEAAFSFFTLIEIGSPKAGPDEDLLA